MGEGRLPLCIKDPLLFPYWLLSSLSHANKHKQKLNNISCVSRSSCSDCCRVPSVPTYIVPYTLPLDWTNRKGLSCSTLHFAHCALHIAHCTLRMGIAHCTVRIAHYVLCTARYTLQIVPYTLRLDWTKREGLSGEGYISQNWHKTLSTFLSHSLEWSVIHFYHKMILTNEQS